MKLALYLPNFRDKVTVKELEDLTSLAEELDFDSVWTLDRIVVPEASDREELQYSFGMMNEFPKALPVSSRGEWLQGWPLIPWLAAKTTKVRIGMSITDTPYRAPGVLAAEIATVDHLSNGRVNVGVGSGWMPEEFAAASASHIFPKRHTARARDDRDHAGHLDERPLRVPRRVRRLRPMRVRSEAGAEAAPADLLQRAQGPEALGEPHREVRPVGLDRDPGHAGRTPAVAQRHPARARGARELPLDRRSRDLQHDLVRHHRRGDRSDAAGQGQQSAGGNRRADHRQPQALQGGRADDAAPLAAVRGRAGREDARRSQAAEGGDHAPGRRGM